MDLPETRRLVKTALEGGDVGPLLLRMRPRLVLWCASRMSPALRAHVEPEDAAQDVLMAVLKDLGSYRGEADGRFFAWFFTVAENKLRDLSDYWGAKKRQPGEPRSVVQTSPSQAAARREMIDVVRDAVAELGEDHRMVVRLLKFESREVAEVAQLMGRTPNAVRILYCRALKELRQRLDANGSGAAPAAGGAG